MNAAVRSTSTPALLSLIFGVLSWFLVPLLGAFGAIICGHMGRSEIRRNPDKLEGDGFAIAGLVLGYVHLGLIVLALVILAAVIILIFGGLAAFLAWAGFAAAA